MIIKNTCFFFIIFGCLLVKQIEGCNTSVDGWTFPYDADNDLPIVGMESVQECAAKCQSSHSCSGYTFTPSQPETLCINFKSLNSTMIPCNGPCTTGSITRIQNGTDCQENVSDQIMEVKVENVDECLNMCRSEAECRHFLYFNEDALFSKTCFLYSSTCGSVKEWCNCQSGNIICLSSPPLPEQCTNYKVLDDATRNVQSGYKKHGDNLANHGSILHPRWATCSPDWKGESWYRFMGGAGTCIPESSPGQNICGTGAPGYLTTSHPTTLGETIPGHVCFDETDALQNNCVVPTDIQITKCKDFFVYYLKQTELHWETRYCGTFNL